MNEQPIGLHGTAYAASPVTVELAQEIAARGAVIEALRAENARYRDELAAIRAEVEKLKEPTPAEGVGVPTTEEQKP